MHGQRIAAEVHTLVLVELVGEIVDYPAIEILTAEKCITVGRQYFELLFAIDLCDLNNRDVERPPAQIVDRDLAISLFLLQPVRQRSCSRLIDDSFHIEARNFAGILGRLPLGIIKVSRHRDHRFSDLRAQIILSRFLHFLQNPRRHLGWRHLLAASLYPSISVLGFDDLVWHEVNVTLYDFFIKFSTDQSLRCEHRVAGIGDGLALGGLPD